VVLVAGVAVAGGTVFVVRAVNREIRAAREKADFVSSVTHELKTPLTSIRMFAETLMMHRVSSEEEKEECVRIIAEETDRLSRLINRMLDFSKMERGLRRFSFREEDPASIAREAKQAFRTDQRAPSEVTLQVLDPLPATRCDREAVIEVLHNFIGNAVKYAPPGSPVTLRVWSARNKVKWAVMDRGSGIPRAERRRIFQKFYRVDDSLTKEVDGCGLGLSIAAHIAKAHGGTIELESEPGRGSIFTLALPAEGPKK
jgi:two-component system phosphate regulon sensor histidine kinase PhoR